MSPRVTAARVAVDRTLRLHTIPSDPGAGRLALTGGAGGAQPADVVSNSTLRISGRLSGSDTIVKSDAEPLGRTGTDNPFPLAAPPT
jgi:hypothetical protein